MAQMKDGQCLMMLLQMFLDQGLLHLSSDVTLMHSSIHYTEIVKISIIW